MKSRGLGAELFAPSILTASVILCSPRLPSLRATFSSQATSFEPNDYTLERTEHPAARSFWTRPLGESDNAALW
jgi:hypothetical protein